MWNKGTDAEESFRNKAIWGSTAAVIVVIAGIGAYYHYYGQSGVPQKIQETAPPPPPPSVAADNGGIQHPIPATAADSTPLPALNESDSVVHASLASLLGAKPIEEFLVPENIVRHIVVTIDNLPRKKVAVDLRPIKPTPGQATIANQGDTSTLSDADYERYTPFVHLVESTDPKTLATVYFHLYPLFQQAYEDLGYPGRFFNDRLVAVIDHLLETPDVQGPIEVVQPKVFYQYADPKLEDLSAGQKLLIRMGPANERSLKTKLGELRTEIVQGKLGSAPEKQQ